MGCFAHAPPPRIIQLAKQRFRHLAGLIQSNVVSAVGAPYIAQTGPAGLSRFGHSQSYLQTDITFHAEGLEAIVIQLLQVDFNSNSIITTTTHLRFHQPSRLNVRKHQTLSSGSGPLNVQRKH